jgi:hypothetical protein
MNAEEEYKKRIAETEEKELAQKINEAIVAAVKAQVDLAELQEARAVLKMRKEDVGRFAERFSEKALEEVTAPLQKAAEGHDEPERIIPLVYYKGIQRIILGTVTIKNGEFTAQIDPSLRKKVALLLEDRSLTGLTMAFSYPKLDTDYYEVESALDRVQFTNPDMEKKKEEVLKKFQPPQAFTKEELSERGYPYG